MSRLLGIVLLTSLPSFASAEGYICTADMVTGFSYKTGEWNVAQFEANRKFIVSAAQNDHPGAPPPVAIPNAKWTVLVLGDKAPTNVCPEFDSIGNLVCLGAFSEFRMNKDSLRFLYSYLTGYWDRVAPGSEAGDTPYMAIGKCGAR